MHTEDINISYITLMLQNNNWYVFAEKWISHQYEITHKWCFYTILIIIIIIINNFKIEVFSLASKLFYLIFNRKQITAGTGHLDMNIIPRVTKLSRIWNRNPAIA